MPKNAANAGLPGLPCCFPAKRDKLKIVGKGIFFERRRFNILFLADIKVNGVLGIKVKNAMPIIIFVIILGAVFMVGWKKAAQADVSEQSLKLGINQKAIFLNELEVTVKGIVIERIEPPPIEGIMQPGAETGVSVHLEIRKGNETGEITLESIGPKISAQSKWKEYTVILEGAGNDYAKLKVVK